MQGLIARREAKARETFERERAVLDRMLESEAAPPKPKPPPPYVPPPIHQYFPATTPQQTNVEPWFNLAKVPTPKDLQCIGQYALGYLEAVRRCGVGSPVVMGTKAAHVICARDADAVAAAMQSLARTIPAGVRLSACLLMVPAGLLGGSISTNVGAMRVVSLAEGQQVSIEVTYD